MKRTKEYIISVAFFLIVNSAYCGTVAAPYEVANWPGFRAGAVSYTFDDGCAKQFSVAMPMFNEFGFKMTLFIFTGWEPNWTALRNAASSGHEVASHTVKHPNLGNLTIAQQTPEIVNSQNSINSNVPSQKCVTIAYPMCVPGDLNLVSQYYIAARHCQGYIDSNSPSNMYQVSSIPCGSLGAVKTADDFNSKFASVAASKGWCVFLIHGIDNDGGYSPLPSSVLRASLQYLDANRNTFWVTTFANAAKYINERNAVSVAESNISDKRITLQVTDNLDNSIYNYPVTLRRPLPAGWKSVKVIQNNRPADANIIDVNSVKYIMFNAIPNEGEVVISNTLPAAKL